MVIYLDIIWLLNLLFDSLLLYLTAIVLKRRIIYWRIIAGGLAGSFIILLTATPFHAIAGAPASKLLFSLLMVYIAFGYKKWRVFFTNLATFYLVSFLIGGILIGAHYFIQFDSNLQTSVLLGSIKGFGDPISWFFIIIGFPVAWHFAKNRFEDVRAAKLRLNGLVDVEVDIFGKKLAFKGLIDSGNAVFDPISKEPVMFISIGKQIGSFPQSIQRIVEDPESFIFGEDIDLPRYDIKVRIIPYKVVGQEHQMIIGFKPEGLIIKQEDSLFEVKKGYISFTKQELSSEDAFQCIVHPQMLAMGKKKKTTEKVS